MMKSTAQPRLLLALLLLLAASVSPSNFAFTFTSKPFGMSLKVTEQGPGEPTKLVVSKVKRNDVSFVVGDVLLRVGDSDVSGWGLKQIAKVLKTAALPLKMAFERP